MNKPKGILDYCHPLIIPILCLSTGIVIGFQFEIKIAARSPEVQQAATLKR